MSSKITTDTVRGLLREAVATDSVNHNYRENRSGEADLCDWVELILQRSGISYESQGVRNRQRNIIARINGRQTDRVLCFEAHLDTTTARGMTIHPFGAEEVGGAIYGRGTCDAKGALAAMLAALRALKDSSEPPPQTVVFAATADKEVGLTGIQLLLASRFRPTATIIGAPTNLAVGRCSRGCTRWRIVVGESPQSYAPASRNAAADATHLIVRLEDRLGRLAAACPHPLLGQAEVYLSRIRANSLEGFLPASCAVDFECYSVPGCTAEDILDEINDLVSSLVAEQPTLKISIEAPTLNSPPIELPESCPLVRAAYQACSSVLGAAQACGYPDAGHANRFAAAGINAITLGPGDPHLVRSAEEHVPVDQLAPAAQIYLTLMRSPLP